MSYAPTDYIQVLPALAASPLSAMYIATAQGLLSSSVFGAQYNYACALLAMHMFTLDQRNLGPGGAIENLKEGQISISYNPGKGKQEDIDYEQTQFGRRLRQLIRSTVPGVSGLGDDGSMAGMLALDPNDIIINSSGGP
jgi:hypothetical protein